MKIALGSDHGGFLLKKEVARHLMVKGIEFTDFGTFDGEQSVDYTDYVWPVAFGVSKGDFDLGILVCGTGIGVAIAANKVKGIRAAICTNGYMARMCREHNDANILTLGGRVLGNGLALEIVDIFLSTSFLGGRHAARLEKIRWMELHGPDATVTNGCAADSSNAPEACARDIKAAGEATGEAVGKSAAADAGANKSK